MADLAGARAAYDRADRIADELDMPFLRIFAAVSRAALVALEGRLDDAERLVADALAMARADRHRNSERPRPVRADRARAMGARRCRHCRAWSFYEHADRRTAPPSRCFTRAWATPTRRPASSSTSPRSDFAIPAQHPSLVTRDGHARRRRHLAAGRRCRSTHPRSPGAGDRPHRLECVQLHYGRSTWRWRSCASCSATMRAPSPTSMPPRAYASARVSSPNRARIELYRVWALRDAGQGGRRAARPGRCRRLAVRRRGPGGGPDGSYTRSMRPSSSTPAGRRRPHADGDRALERLEDLAELHVQLMVLRQDAILEGLLGPPTASSRSSTRLPVSPRLRLRSCCAQTAPTSRCWRRRRQPACSASPIVARGREAQSTAFLRTPGTDRLYSGVANRSASASSICAAQPCDGRSEGASLASSSPSERRDLA